MPNRILRDGILRSEKIAALSPLAELFYRRLMSVADDFGRYYARLELLLSDCYPIRPEWADVEMISKALAECRLNGLVTVYVISGISFLQIENFSQRIRPGQASKFPPSAENCGETREDSATRARTPTPTPTPTALCVEGGAGETSREISSTELNPAMVFDEPWQTYIAYFARGGKIVSIYDLNKAFTLWCRLDFENKLAAIKHAELICGASDEGRFIANPVKHLRERQWNNIALPRTLPVVKRDTPSERATKEARRRVFGDEASR